MGGFRVHLLLLPLLLWGFVPAVARPACEDAREIVLERRYTFPATLSTSEIRRQATVRILRDAVIEAGDPTVRARQSLVTREDRRGVERAYREQMLLQLRGAVAEHRTTVGKVQRKGDVATVRVRTQAKVCPADRQDFPWILAVAAGDFRSRILSAISRRAVALAGDSLLVTSDDPARFYADVVIRVRLDKRFEPRDLSDLARDIEKVLHRRVRQKRIWIRRLRLEIVAEILPLDHTLVFEKEARYPAGSRRRADPRRDREIATALLGQLSSELVQELDRLYRRTR